MNACSECNNVLHTVVICQSAIGFFLFSVLFVYSNYTVSQKTATFIFTITLANVGRFLKFFQCRNQKEMAHNKNEKFPLPRLQ